MTLLTILGRPLSCKLKDSERFSLLPDVCLSLCVY